MCDETDVENTLKSMIIGYLYPNGTGQSCAAGVPCQVARGWPTTADFTLANSQSASGMPGLVIVSVCTRIGVERNTTRKPLSWIPSVAPVHTLTATVGGSQKNQITIAGTTATPQNVIALVGGSADVQAFSYAVQPADTVNSIASGLAALIAGSFAGTTSSGAVITVNSTLPVEARVTAAGTAIQIVGQQCKEFQITIWSPPCNVADQDADTWRTAVSKIISPPLRNLNRISMIDGVWAMIRYERTVTLDTAQSQGLYRRDLFFQIEFAETVAMTAHEIGAAQQQVQAAVSPTGKLPVPSNAPTLTTNS